MSRKTTCCFPQEEKQTAINLALQVRQAPDGDTIDFYLPMEIEEDTTEYRDFFRCARYAKSGDTINLHINCYGGSLQVAYNIIDVLQESQANVEIYIEGGCCSAASMIALAGNTWHISEHAYMMIHAWTSCSFGKWNEQQARFRFDEDWLERMFRKTYKNFLTDEEIEDVLSGKDLYFDSEQIQERLSRSQEEGQKRQQILNEITQRYEKEINAEIQKALQVFSDEDKNKNKDKKISNNQKKGVKSAKNSK